jgi:hypothetical protein
VEPESLWREVWCPPAETLEAIAAVLRERWRAAHAWPQQFFWSTPPASWLRAGRNGHADDHG